MNPISAKPDEAGLDRQRRKLFCRHYGGCLDLAIKRRWPGFACTECDDFEPDTWDRENYDDDRRKCTALILRALKPRDTSWTRPGQIIGFLEHRARRKQTLAPEID